MSAPKKPLCALILLIATACAGEDPRTGMGATSVDTDSSATDGSTVPDPSLPAGSASPPTATWSSAGAPAQPPPSGAGSGGMPTEPGTGGAPAETGGGGAGPAFETPSEDVPRYADIYYMINLTCSNVVCHVPAYFMPDLSDANGDQYDILLAWTVEECGNLPLVTPGDTERSAILKVTKRGECGELLMPMGCTDDDCLPEEKRAALTTWIAAGAPR